MTGRKKLAEVRAELEAALGAGPSGSGEVAQSLRRFLAADGEDPPKAPQHPGSGGSVPPAGQSPQPPAVAEPGR